MVDSEPHNKLGRNGGEKVTESQGDKENEIRDYESSSLSHRRPKKKSKKKTKKEKGEEKDKKQMGETPKDQG